MKTKAVKIMQTGVNANTITTANNITNSANFVVNTNSNNSNNNNNSNDLELQDLDVITPGFIVPFFFLSPLLNGIFPFHSSFHHHQKKTKRKI